MLTKEVSNLSIIFLFLDIHSSVAINSEGESSALISSSSKCVPSIQKYSLCLEGILLLKLLNFLILGLFLLVIIKIDWSIALD